MRKNMEYRLTLLLFILPALFLFIVFECYPIIQTLYRSLFEWDGLSKPIFIGFENYIKMFGSEDFFISNKNGLYFSGVLVFYQIGLGLFFALLLATNGIKLGRFFRTAYFLPVVLSITVACQLWLAIYNPDRGLINKIFEAVGIAYRQNWISGEKTAIFAVAFVNAWQYMGIHLVLFYTAIKSIPEQYYEAATIDGASTFRAHLAITIPLLGETIKFCLIIAITGGLKAFENMFIMTGGGPGTFTNTLTYLMYKSAFLSNSFGYACASATILVLQCLIFTLLINRFIARERIVY